MSLPYRNFLPQYDVLTLLYHTVAYQRASLHFLLQLTPRIYHGLQVYKFRKYGTDIDSFSTVTHRTWPYGIPYRTHEPYSRLVLTFMP